MIDTDLIIFGIDVDMDDALFLTNFDLDGDCDKAETSDLTELFFKVGSKLIDDEIAE